MATAANAAPVRTPALQLPYTFELNQGQTDPSVRYLARGKGYTLFLTDLEAVMKLQRSASSEVLRMSLAGGRAPMQVDALDREGSSNYFVGDARQWKRDVPRFARVRYRGVYPGIDVLYHSQEGQLEYDFVVAPGASPSAIGVRFDGAKQIRVNRAGDLELALAGGTLVHRRPVAWQEVAGARHSVEANYVVRDGAVGFRLGAYDRSLPLVIDPVVVYSTYIGGNAVDTVNAVAVDKDGNTYLAGETTSIDFPTAGTAFTKMQFALTYGFVMKLNPAGNKIIYSSYLGGGSSTRGLAIAVDGDGNAYLGGVTGARDFPLANATQTTQPGLNIGFVTKLNAAGDKLLFSTYLGGERNDRVDALAIDAQGSIYVTGYASSTTLPVVNAFQPKIAGSNDALVAKFAAPNYRVAYCSYLGGLGADDPYGIGVDAQGNAFVTGYTVSPNLATVGAYQTKIATTGDNFVAKIRPAGDGLAFFTYVGGNG
ncbi:MAG TPA: SBBP repeat-containing protein, partial [Candidatus Acidoferrum sp.]|nr:SBBP repeat-containing protein [Candidatus Acidoferrum sp.]